MEARERVRGRTHTHTHTHTPTVCKPLTASCRDLAAGIPAAVTAPARACAPLHARVLRRFSPGQRFRDSMDCSPPGSSVQGIIPARILEWVALSFTREQSQRQALTADRRVEAESQPPPPSPCTYRPGTIHSPQASVKVDSHLPFLKCGAGSALKGLF